MRLLGLNLPIFSVVQEDKGRIWSHQKDSRTWTASLEFGCQVTSCTTIKSEPSVHWLFLPESLREPMLTLIAKTWQRIFWTSFVAGESMKTSLWYSRFWSRRVSVSGCGDNRSQSTATFLHWGSNYHWMPSLVGIVTRLIAAFDRMATRTVCQSPYSL